MATTCWFDRHGDPIEDPWQVLGLRPGTAREAIRDAYREAVLAHPPQVDPDGFRRIDGAYRLLTDPDRVATRELGCLSIGSPADHGLVPATATDAPRSALEIVSGDLLLHALAELLGES